MTPLLPLIPWLVLFPALAAVWWPRAWPAARIGVALGIILAIAVGQMTAWSALPVAALGAAAWALAPGRPTAVRIAGHVAFVVVALVLRQHVAPGFHNPRILDAVLSPGAPRYRMYFNLDELLLIPVLLWAWRRARFMPDERPVRTGVVSGLATAVVVLGAGLALGMVSPDPKWPSLAPMWLLNNFLLVSLGDELLFRGYLQQGLADRFPGPRGSVIAIGVASVLFGLAHYGGGPALMVLAGMAGVGYGVAYRYAGLRAAWLAHCLLNGVHFFLLTYPALIR